MKRALLALIGGRSDTPPPPARSAGGHTCGAGALALGTMLLLATAAHADEPGPGTESAPPIATAPASPHAVGEQLLAVAVLRTPTYPGSANDEVKLRPAFAFRLGRWQIHSPRASDLGGLRAVREEAGASTVLREDAHWQTGLSLRLSSGRRASDDPVLAGLPDIPRSLDVRLSATRRLGAGWAASVGAQRAVGGGAPGSRLLLGVGWSGALGEGWRARGGLAAEAGSRSFNHTYFGVEPAQALPGERPAYAPGAGWIDVSFTAGVQKRLSPHWVLTATAGRGRLLGPAADSPLTRRTASTTLLLGLAWVPGGP